MALLGRPAVLVALDLAPDCRDLPPRQQVGLVGLPGGIAIAEALDELLADERAGLIGIIVRHGHHHDHGMWHRLVLPG